MNLHFFPCLQNISTDRATCLEDLPAAATAAARLSPSAAPASSSAAAAGASSNGAAAASSFADLSADRKDGPVPMDVCSIERTH